MRAILYQTSCIMEKKVAMLIDLILVPSFFLLQRKFDDGEGQGVSGFYPGIKITFADEAGIDACLALSSLASVGPGNGVPQLIRGEKLFC